MENCVLNQTLLDESCLVPCAGLYADIANDVDSLQQATEALEQNVVRGRICLFCVFTDQIKVSKH